MVRKDYLYLQNGLLVGQGKGVLQCPLVPAGGSVAKGIRAKSWFQNLLRRTTFQETQCERRETKLFSAARYPE